MHTEIEQVKSFHLAFEVPVQSLPQIPPEERCVLRQRILQEEVDELNEAWQQGNLTQVADAITDCLYILFGTAHEFGIAHLLPACFEEVHRSNMSKLGEDGKPLKREDGKVIKSANYIPPNLKSIIEKEHYE